MSKVRKVAALFFNGYAPLDVFGPIQSFESCRVDGRAVFDVIAVGIDPGEFASGPQCLGVQVRSRVTIKDLPEVDVLLVPGGFGTRRLVDDRAWIRQLKHEVCRANIVASVCTGAALLAKAGVLENRQATTNRLAWQWVLNQGTNVQWDDTRRWCTHGKYWTSAGVSAGIEMSLALIQSLFGIDIAHDTAVRMEYTWNSDPENYLQHRENEKV